MRIRDAGELQRALDDDFSWRVQELQNVQQIASKLRSHASGTMLRAAIPLIYAHYEGFIKISAISYASFISNSGLKFYELKTCMRGVRAMQKVHQISEIARRFSAAGLLLEEIIGLTNETASIPLQDYISNVGNLDFDVLCQILDLLHLNSAYYQGRKAFIEETLLRNRNGIAHGERYPIDDALFIDLHAGVLSIIRSFKTDIENAVTLKTYLAH